MFRIPFVIALDVDLGQETISKFLLAIIKLSRVNSHRPTIYMVKLSPITCQVQLENVNYQSDLIIFNLTLLLYIYSMSCGPLEKLKTTNQLQHLKSTHIRKIDKQIRKKWKELYHYRKGRVSILNPEQGLAIRHQTQMTDNSIFRCNIDAYKIQSLKAGLIRQKTHEKISKNEEIFYRKRSQELPKKKSSGLLIHRMSCQLPRKDSGSLIKKNGYSDRSEEKLPFMLRRRKYVVEKQYGIIDQQYGRSLQKIKSKDEFKKQLKYQEKIRLINKMKGTKVYYKFIRPTNVPDMSSYEDN